MVKFDPKKAAIFKEGVLYAGYGDEYFVRYLVESKVIGVWEMLANCGGLFVALYGPLYFLSRFVPYDYAFLANATYSWKGPTTNKISDDKAQPIPNNHNLCLYRNSAYRHALRKVKQDVD